ncbi:zinc finger, CCHC-type containing protein [Tanacetum coccineum]
MATTVVNNSVFRSFFEKHKLTGANFIDCQFLPKLLQLTLHGSKDKEIDVLMLMTMELDLQWDLETLGAYDMLKELKTLFSQQAEQELLQTVRDFHAFSLILVSLRKEYDSFVQNYNMHSMGKTLNEQGPEEKQKLETQLDARGNNKGKGKSKLAYALKPRIPPPPKKVGPAKDSVCHHYGDTGHWKWNRPQYLSELLKYKKLPLGASTSGIFTIELFTFLGKSWVYDTGYGTHICNNTQGFRGSRKLKPGALSLDGIFEIVLSNSNTNDCSMYAVSNKRAKLKLNSSLLWRCRLGHISKKRIEKLQHDGLLNSIDTKVFEKCVSCFSGKMARKPYSHQVERAKDLLGLIYTDDYALESAARILNMVPTKKVEKTPYEVWIPKENNSLITQEASGSLEDLELIQEEDTHPSENTSSHHDEDNQEIDEPQSDIIPIRRSTRTRHAPDRMCLNIEADEYEFWES